MNYLRSMERKMMTNVEPIFTGQEYQDLSVVNTVNRKTVRRKVHEFQKSVTIIC